MISPHPQFVDALAAVDAGALDRLQALLAAEPSLVHARAAMEPPLDYFSGATLLHHVAGNPDRGYLTGTWRLPPNVIEIARALLDAGADIHAVTLGPVPSDTMGLLVTSKQASDLDISGPLLALLLERGARLDLAAADALDAPLANHAPRAAEKMIELGAPVDLISAAALGRMDLLREAFDANGRLRERPRRRGAQLSDRDAIGLAALFAYVRKEREAVDFLLARDGNWNMTGVNNGTLLHRAAWDGDIDMVQRLVALGADVNDRNNPYDGTPLAWARHNNQDATAQYLAQHGGQS